MLEAHGWLENSIIVVASDNGGCPSEGGSNYPLRGSKQSMFEGGTKVKGQIFSFCCCWFFSKHFVFAFFVCPFFRMCAYCGACANVGR